MADSKLSALTALAAAPASDDEIYIRDVSEAAASESKRITMSYLFNSPAITTPIIASLYQTSGGGLITVPASAGADTIVLLGATQTLTAKTLTSPTINGTIATTGLTLPAVTIDDDLTIGTVANNGFILRDSGRRLEISPLADLSDDFWFKLKGGNEPADLPFGFNAESKAIHPAIKTCTVGDTLGNSHVHAYGGMYWNGAISQDCSVEISLMQLTTNPTFELQWRSYDAGVLMNNLMSLRENGDLHLLSGHLFWDVDAKSIRPPDVDNNYFYFVARDNGVGLVEVARLQGAADPYFSMGGSQQFKFYNSGVATFGAVTLGGNMTLGGYVFDAGSGNAQINTSGAEKGLLLNSTNVDYGANIYFQHNDKAATRTIGQLSFQGYDGAGTPALMRYGMLRFVYENVTDTTESGAMYVYLAAAGAADNQALTLTGAGVLAVDLSGSGSAAQVDLFDDYDDALVLRQGIQQNNRELLADIGVLERKDTGSGYMMNLQPMVRLLAGGIYQTRQMLEDTRDELSARLESIERKLLEAG